MNIYEFNGSRCNIRIFNMTQRTLSPLMYVAEHSSPGWNLLQLGHVPPASHLASRPVSILISSLPNYSKPDVIRARSQLTPNQGRK